MSSSLKVQLEELQLKYNTLVKVALDLQWPAKRYASGRQTHVVDQVNEATRTLFRLGIPVSPDGGIVWALDGGGRDFDKLTDRQTLPGTLEAWGHPENPISVSGRIFIGVDQVIIDGHFDE